MKKIVALLLVLAMAISLIACGNTNNNETPNAGNADTPNAGTADNAGNDSAEIEEVTLSVFVVTQGDLTAGIADDPVAQLIKEKTGVTLDIVPYDADKHSAMVASGDLYDVTVVVGAENVAPLIKQGAVADLSSWIDQAPSVAANNGLLNYSKQYLSDENGGLYVLPLRTKSEPVPMMSDQNGWFIRWDYYKEAGCPEINSLDDMLDLLETIQNNHPTNADGQKAYALSGWSDWGVALWTGVDKTFGLMNLFSNLGCYNMSTLEYADLFSDNHALMMNAKFMFEANQRGLVDPEAFSQKYEDFVVKVNDGRVLCSGVEYGCRDASNLLAAAGEAGFVEIPFADTAEFPSWVNRAVPFGYTARLLMVSSKCDETKMAAVMRLLNFIYSEDGARSILTGPEGIVWEKDENGVAQFTEEALAAMATDPNYLNSQGASWHTGMVGYDFDAKDSNGKFLNLTMNPEFLVDSMKDYQKEYCEHFGVDVPIEVFSNRANQSAENQGINSFMPTEIPTDISRITASVSDYISSELYNLVLSKDQAAFDAKLAEIRAKLVELDYQTASDWYKAAFENAVATYNEVVG